MTGLFHFIRSSRFIHVTTYCRTLFRLNNIPLCRGLCVCVCVCTISFAIHPLMDIRLFPEKAVAPHSITPAWGIPWTEELGGLQSMGSLRVGHDWASSLSLFTFMHWRRKWQPTPVFLPGESQGRGSLVGCRLWGGTELDMTEATWRQQQQAVSASWLL